MNPKALPASRDMAAFVSYEIDRPALRLIISFLPAIERFAQSERTPNLEAEHLGDPPRSATFKSPWPLVPESDNGPTPAIDRKFRAASLPRDIRLRTAQAPRSGNKRHVRRLHRAEPGSQRGAALSA